MEVHSHCPNEEAAQQKAEEEGQASLKAQQEEDQKRLEAEELERQQAKNKAKAEERLTGLGGEELELERAKVAAELQQLRDEAVARRNAVEETIAQTQASLDAATARLADEQARQGAAKEEDARSDVDRERSIDRYRK